MGPDRADGKAGSTTGTVRQTTSLLDSLPKIDADDYKLVRTTPYVKAGTTHGSQGTRILNDSNKLTLVSDCPETDRQGEVLPFLLGLAPDPGRRVRVEPPNIQYSTFNGRGRPEGQRHAFRLAAGRPLYQRRNSAELREHAKVKERRDRRTTTSSSPPWFWRSKAPPKHDTLRGAAWGHLAACLFVVRRQTRRGLATLRWLHAPAARSEVNRGVRESTVRPGC